MSFKFKERIFSYEKPEILNGIYLLKYGGTFFGMWGIKGYFLLVDNIFLDTGNHNSDRRVFTKFLHTLDKKRDWKVLNTHLHEDHCGKNTIVQKVLGAEIFSPESVDDFTFVSWMMDCVWGRPEIFTHSLLDKPSYKTDNGRNIEVIATPGHSPAHTAFRIMPDNIVYSGDAIPLPVRKRYITSGEDYIGEIESLKLLLKYAEEGALFVSAHHGILKDPVKTINERISGMGDAVGEVSRLLEKGHDSISDISNIVFGKPDFIYRRLGNQIRCRQDWTVSSIVEGLKNR